MFQSSMTSRRTVPTKNRVRAPKQFKGRTRPNLSISSKFKTELCHYLPEQGHCPFGDNCTYAHAESELRYIERHPKHKTQPCRDFSNEGFCSFGERCSFIHLKTTPEIVQKPQPIGLTITEHGDANDEEIRNLFSEGNFFNDNMLHDTGAMFLRPPTVSSGYCGSTGSSSMSRASSPADFAEYSSDFFSAPSSPRYEPEVSSSRLPVFRDITKRLSLSTDLFDLGWCV